MAYYKINKLTDRLYSIYEPAEVFCYLWVGEKAAVLYDTTFGMGDLAQAVHEVIGELPLHVVLSHGHYDHVNGAAQFKSAYIHAEDKVLCLKHASRTGRRRAIDNYAIYEQPLPEGFDADVYIHAGAGTLKMVEIGHIFDLGSLTIEVVALEGHTAGSIGLLAREPRILLTSDALGPHHWLFLNESLPMTDYLAMLTRTQRLPFDFFYIGHSNTPRPISELDAYKTVAQNAVVEKSTPYPRYPELNGWFYKEGDISIVFNAQKL
ncbi:MAG: MBL fold metallo-hydrolase [Defluviitaleaceae bacterium]|nr:MBL fold metallo-hydrolase [Defluviitaleaceae bacterium]MCL2274746.1 MBL fold metallo-hydrolase [Defluviitaleaceae bacterium]